MIAPAIHSSEVGITAGQAALTFEHVAGRTVITRNRATSPLRLLTPGQSNIAGWAFTSSYGGGLLSGDSVSLDLYAAPGATAYVSTQSSTKIYRSRDARAATQSLHARVDDDATLILAPDPVVCFADARYVQTQTFDIAPGGNVVLLDWFTSGRHARGERWAFHALDSTNQIEIGGARVLTDRLRLDHAAPIPLAARMAGFNCIATLIVLGPRLASRAAAILNQIATMQVRRNDCAPIAASPLRDGVIMRLAAPSVEQAGVTLFHHLAFLENLLGEHPWLRKW